MNKILFVSALSAELKIVKQEIKKLNISKKDLEISFFVTWMWNYKTILNLTEFLSKNNFDFIINIWVCGYIYNFENSEIDDFIQVWRVKNLSNDKELIIPNILDFWKIESIFSSEKIVYDDSILLPLLTREEARGWVDMESYWFELVCEKFEIPRIILKIPVDKIWEETKNFDFEKAKKKLAENINYEKLIFEIKKYLDKNNIEEKNIEKYFNRFNFSETQKIIFEKLFNKYNILVWDDFYNYFNDYLLKFKDKKIVKNDIKKFLIDLEKFLEDK